MQVNLYTTTTTTTILHPFFRDHPAKPVPEENFWTLCCKGRLTEADTMIIRLGATLSGLTNAHFRHPHIFFTGRMPFLPPNQQRQSTEDNQINLSNGCKRLCVYVCVIVLIACAYIFCECDW